MKTKEVMMLAAQIAFYYTENGDSTAINSIIARALTKDQYFKFCDITANPEKQRKFFAFEVVFKKEFLNNPVNTEDEARDKQIQKHYPLDKLLECLAEAIE